MSYIFNIKTLDDLDAFLDNGGNINQQNHLGQTLLHKSVINNNTLMIDHILTKTGVKFLKDISGHGPIYYVSDEDTAMKLASNGSSLDIKSNKCCQDTYNKLMMAQLK